MIDSTAIPCTDWVQKLSARHQEDLSLAEREALNEHLASCRACNEVYAAYKSLETGIRSLTIATSIPEFSYSSIQSKRKIPEFAPVLSLQSLCLMILATLSSFCLSISRTPVYQKVHTWMLIALASFPRRIAYVNSGNRFVYAMRTDSGYCLWRQKRYQKHELISNSSIRCSGVSYIGIGIAQAAFLDFCRYAVQP
jgi:hypothetical protein